MQIILLVVIAPFFLAAWAIGESFGLWRKVKRRYWIAIGSVVGFFALLCIGSEMFYGFVQEPFYGAARRGHLGELRAYLLLHADIEGEVDDGGGTALVAACAEGRTGIVRELIARGADVNHASDYYFRDHDRKFTPLQAASPYPEIQELLRKAGAKQVQ